MKNNFLNNKFLKFAVVTAFVLGLTGMSTAQSLSGSGTESDPYMITSCSDLTEMNDDMDAYYQLENNIDCSDVSSINIDGGDGSDFTGTFDGDDKVISDITVKSSSDSVMVGLFYGSKADVENLIVDGVDFDTSNSYSGVSVLNAGYVNNVEIRNLNTTAPSDAAIFGPFGVRNTVENSLINIDYLDISQAGDSASAVASDFGTNIKNTGVEIDGELIFRSGQGVMQSDEGADGRVNIENSYIDGNVTVDNTEGTYSGIFASRLDDGKTFNNNYFVGKLNVPSSIENEVNPFVDSGGATVNNSFFSADVNYPDNVIFDSDNNYVDTYNDQQRFATTSTSGITNLDTSEMKGDSAETNMDGLDFTNTWVTQTNPEDYPTFFYTLDATASLNFPEDNSEFASGNSQDLSYDVKANGDSPTIELKVEYPNGTTKTEATDSLSTAETQTFNKSLTFTESGTYQWFVDLDGSTATSVRSFDVIDYSSPSINLNSPVDETVNGYNPENDVDFSFDVDSDVEGTYYLQVKNSSESSYTNETSGSFSEGSSTIDETVSIDFPTSGTQDKDWRVRTEDEIGDFTTSSSTFTVERFEEPTITIERPDDGESFWTEKGSKTEIAFEGWVNSSEDSGEAFAKAEKFTEDIVDTYSDSIGSVSEGDQLVSGDLNVDSGDYENARISVDLDSGNTFESDSVNFEVKNANPEITNFTVNPDISDIEVGEYFDVNVEGDIKRDEIEKITYKLEKDDGDPTTDDETLETVKKDPIDFQDDDQFTDGVKDAFEMKEEYQGERLNIDVIVEDTEGLTDFEEVEGDTNTPPDDFLFNDPSDGEVFLIEEGDSTTNVTIDYGVDSAEYSGTAKLFVNGEQKDSFSVDANSASSNQYTTSYGESNNKWTIEWEDSQGLTYSAGTNRTFDVTDEPVSLQPREPDQDETFNIGGLDSLDIDHTFFIDSRAMANEDHYYEFTLEDENGSEVASETSSNTESGEQEHTETVSVSEKGDYSWNVLVYRSNDDKLLENKTRDYTVEKRPLFTHKILSPNDGDTYTVTPEETKNISYAVDVETFEDSTDFDVLLDGENIETENVDTRTDKSINGEFTDLESGEYNFTFKGEDESGRTNSSTAVFNVEEEEEENETVEIDTVEFNPSLENADPGDELDIYVEGSGVPENVEAVAVDVSANGETETIEVPVDELEEGSWIYEAKNALEFPTEWVGQEISITGVVEDTVGRVSTFFKSLTHDVEMSANLESPEEGAVFRQSPGDDIKIPFSGSVTGGLNEVSYNVIVDNQNLFGDTVSADTTEEFGKFLSVSNFSDDDFGNFTARIKYEDQSTGDEGYVSNDFKIVNDNETEVNILNPSEGEVVETFPSDTTDYKFRFEVYTAEAGEVELKIRDLDEDTENTIDSFDQRITESEAEQDQVVRTPTVEMRQGVYSAIVTFESDSGETVEERNSFEVVREEEEPSEEDEVRLRNPSEGSSYPRLVAPRFSWDVTSFEDSDPVNSTFYLEDSDGDVEAEYFREITKIGERMVFNERLDQDLSQGNYQFYAELDNGEDVLTTETRNLTIEDTEKPDTSLDSQDLGAFSEADPVVFEWETETYQQNATVELVTRPENSNVENVEKSFQQDSYETVDYSEEVEGFEPGVYEYYIRSTVNPSVTSDVGTFTVEDEEIEDANVTLVEPEQDAEYEYNSSEEDNASVDFVFDAEAFTEADTTFEVMVQEAGEEEDDNYETVENFTASNDDGLETYTATEDLEESGYRWKVVAENLGDEKETSSRSFIVNDVETEETPEIPTASPAFNVFGEISDYGDRFLGGNAQFVLAFLTLLGVSTGVTVRTRSDKIGLATMVALALGFSYTGWFPSWIAAVFTLIAVGISVWTVNLLVEGRGEL